MACIFARMVAHSICRHCEHSQGWWQGRGCWQQSHFVFFVKSFNVLLEYVLMLPLHWIYTCTYLETDLCNQGYHLSLPVGQALLLVHKWLWPLTRNCHLSTQQTTTCSFVSAFVSPVTQDQPTWVTGHLPWCSPCPHSVRAHCDGHSGIFSSRTVIPCGTRCGMRGRGAAERAVDRWSPELPAQVYLNLLVLLVQS